MRTLLALFAPFVLFFSINRPFAGIISMLLQMTLIGWPIATLWAFRGLSQYKLEQRIRKLE